MAKVLNNNGKISGSLGNTTYRFSKGQYQAYQKTRPTDARTKRQVMLRCSFANISHFCSCQKALVWSAFEFKGQAQNDYNLFLKHNIGKDAAHVYLTKQESGAGYCIAAPYTVTVGSLGTVGVSLDEEERYVSGISLGDLVISEETTVAEFSVAVITSNGSRGFMDGDRITFCEYVQYETDGIPRVKGFAHSIGLHTGDERLLWQVMSPEAFQSVGGWLASLPGLPDGAYCWIHTRETEQGKTLLSTERLCCHNALLERFTGNKAFKRAARSYGGYNDSILSGDGESRSTGSALEREAAPVAIMAEVAPKGKRMGTVRIGEGPLRAVAQKTVPSGTQLTLCAHAKKGFRFKQWQDGNKREERPVVALMDKTYTAEFEKIGDS